MLGSHIADNPRIWQATCKETYRTGRRQVRESGICSNPAGPETRSAVPRGRRKQRVCRGIRNIEGRDCMQISRRHPFLSLRRNRNLATSMPVWRAEPTTNLRPPERVECKLHLWPERRGCVPHRTSGTLLLPADRSLAGHDCPIRAHRRASQGSVQSILHSSNVLFALHNKSGMFIFVFKTARPQASAYRSAPTYPPPTSALSSGKSSSLAGTLLRSPPDPPPPAGFVVSGRP